MEENKLLSDEKNLTEQVIEIQKRLKENKTSLEEIQQLSKVGQGFFQETLALLQGSSEGHIFQGFYDELVSLDKKLKGDIEREYDELQSEYRFVSSRVDEMASQKRRLEEEKNGR